MSNTKTVMGQASNQYVVPLDITDVFSTYLYTGTGSAQTITNDIDLEGEGGMVWVKNRDTTDSHHLCDTERGSGKIIFSNFTNGQVTNNNTISGFSASGFSLGGDAAVSTNGENYASWTWRKAPKFFDVVTWTGDGNNNRQIAHNLGCEVGCLIVKRTDTTKNWRVYHRKANATPENGRLTLNSAGDWYDELNEGGLSQNQSIWWYTAPTSTDFTVGSNVDVNASGGTYVAYLFAHNDGDGEFGPSGDQDIIKCGSYTGNGSGTAGPTVDLGFEPQWILAKRTDSTGYWTLVDSMRGMIAGGDDKLLYPNTSDAEQQSTRFVPSATGFQVNSTNAYVNASGGDYIYIAIRRGPLAPPESATEVFDVTSYTADNTDNRLITTGNVVDTVLARTYSHTSERGFNVGDRIRGLDFLGTAVTYGDGGDSDSFMGFDHMKGFEVGNDATRRLNYSSYSQIAYTWTRAPNFFEVVAYTGDGVAGRTVSHSLGVAPEMMWVKRRNSTGHWYVYHTGMTGGSDALHSTSRLNLAEAGFDTQSWKNYDFTDAHFSLDNGADINGSGGTYIAYLFASLDGISKVGSYTGNGTSQTIDCGFTSGARFVLIKCTTVAYDWQVFDTERGIVAGNDSKLALNTTQAEQTNVDFIDPSSSGFAVTSSSSMNANGETYIFYAIA
jgi:hypothetical protein